MYDLRGRAEMSLVTAQSWHNNSSGLRDTINGYKLRTAFEKFLQKRVFQRQLFFIPNAYEDQGPFLFEI